MFFFFWQVAHGISLEELQVRFSEQNTVRADFSQKKYISGMTQALQSRGQMIMSKEYGLWWQQQSPFEMTILLDDGQMIQMVAQQQPHIINESSNPQLFQFNALLQAILVADQVFLKKDFWIDFKDLGEEQWRLTLQPMTSPLDQIFSSIELSGGEFLQNIHIQDKQGDVTDILFENQLTQPDTLNEVEAMHFAPLLLNE